MKKTFKDYLTEGPGDPDWMKMGDPKDLSASERFQANELPRTDPTAQERIEKRRAAPSIKQGYEQGPAINDIKAVLERLQKLEDEFDSLAGNVAGGDGMEPSEIARELDGIRERVSAMVQTLNKAWKHLAIGSNKPYHG